MRTPKRRVGVASTALIIAILACPLAAASRRGKTGEAVDEAIAADGEALVVVSLEPPPAAEASYFDPRELRDQVARLQGEVLSGLSDADFRVIYRYDFVPGLFGAVSARTAPTSNSSAPGRPRTTTDMAATSRASLPRAERSRRSEWLPTPRSWQSRFSETTARVDSRTSSPGSPG